MSAIKQFENISALRKISRLAGKSYIYIYIYTHIEGKLYSGDRQNNVTVDFLTSLYY